MGSRGQHGDSAGLRLAPLGGAQSFSAVPNATSATRRAIVKEVKRRPHDAEIVRSRTLATNTLGVHTKRIGP
jgi:hypothetical protein